MCLALELEASNDQQWQTKSPLTSFENFGTNANYNIPYGGIIWKTNCRPQLHLVTELYKQQPQVASKHMTL
jgi:hypothetical protein